MLIPTIKHASAWSPHAMLADPSCWQYALTEADLAEIATALQHLKLKKPETFLLQKSDFPLEKLADKLQQIQIGLEEGLGIFLLRGVPVDQYSQDEVRWLYAGLAAYIGTLTCQSKAGELIHDVGDVGKRLFDKTGRGTTTSDPLPFHTDRCDVVTLLCLQQSKKGGQSRVASAISVHNEMAEKYPDLLEILYRDFHHARAAWEVQDESPTYALPVFSVCNGKIACRYLRHFINMAQNEKGVPPLTQKQLEALTVFERLVQSPEHCLDMDFLPGDVQFLNNFVSLHSRAGYEDDPNKKRHLLRLWLSVPNSRPLDKSFLPLYRAVEAGAIRGGLPQEVPHV